MISRPNDMMKPSNISKPCYGRRNRWWFACFLPSLATADKDNRAWHLSSNAHVPSLAKTWMFWWRRQKLPITRTISRKSSQLAMLHPIIWEDRLKNCLVWFWLVRRLSLFKRSTSAIRFSVKVLANFWASFVSLSNVASEILPLISFRLWLSVRPRLWHDVVERVRFPEVISTVSYKVSSMNTS